ncbi:DUF6992 family protein [Rubrivirga litoralis]|uniref:Uncharacterized protein n=1 Tax=Rubrivirga litoralis TaxID=3075598 RepID=A0ABU3BT56_9BACT|nr:hypothetical protein [Rubrivirga sp. F394]MDT0632472.1 hypothetical protein [Rubrivirga sp. F394]
MSTRPARFALGLAAVLLTGLAAHPALAQDGPAVRALSVDLGDAQRAHLWRVGAWGVANAVGGAALWLASSPETSAGWRAFGLQSAAWGAVNTGIAAFGLAGGAGDPAADWAAALGAENGYADVLLVNLGLNVGYAAVGATLWAVSGRGVADPAAWRGHGIALVIQGAGLFVLDGIAYLGTRARLGALVDLANGASITAGPGGVALVVGL